MNEDIQNIITSFQALYKQDKENLRAACNSEADARKPSFKEIFTLSDDALELKRLHANSWHLINCIIQGLTASLLDECNPEDIQLIKDMIKKARQDGEARVAHARTK